MFEKFLYCICIIFISTTSLIECQPGTICTHFDDVSKAESCSGETIYVENDKGSVSKSELKDIVNKTFAKKCSAIKDQVDNLERKLNATAIESGKFRMESANSCNELVNLGVNTSGVYNITVGKKVTEVYCDIKTDVDGWTVLQRKTSNNFEFIMSRKLSVKNCYDRELLGFKTSGVYNITVGENITEVYCDMEPDCGGRTVIQRRTSGAVDFYRDWQAYKVGFGDIPDNFWLGLEAIHKITSSQSYQLRVDLEDFSGNRAYALYSSFSIENESSNYRLHVSGYSGNAGDGLSGHNNRPFTTKDRDNDHVGCNCAVSYHGAWWYNCCANSNLNGKYYSSGVSDVKGVNWYGWKSHQSLKRVEMKIKPN